jgi:acyl-CoA synthetase (AMP-forming)/AMP-acid ligase II
VNVIGQLGDKLHFVRTLGQTGIVRPTRPDRLVRAGLALVKWGPTPAAGYAASAARDPDATAIIDELGTLTFRQVHERSNALASQLARRGIGEGDAIAILARNHRGFVDAVVACSKLGCHSLFLNTMFAGPQITDVCEREQPAAIIYDEEFATLVHEALVDRQGFVAWADGAHRAGQHQ